MFAHLHVRSWFSFLAGGSSPSSLVQEAATLGIAALALTDKNGVYGAVRFQRACRDHGLKAIIGAEVTVEDSSLVFIARSSDGYFNLCRIISRAHSTSRNNPTLSLYELADHNDDLYCLTGTRSSALWTATDEGDLRRAREHLSSLKKFFGDRLYVELSHHLLPGDGRRSRRLVRFAEAMGVPCVVTGDVHYARREHYRRYDLMSCIREGTTVFDRHPKRPKNDEAYLKSEIELRRLLPYPEAFVAASKIAADCNVDLLPGHLIPPAAQRITEDAPVRYLRRLCEDALLVQYGDDRRVEAEHQLEHELDVIASLKLSDFFLVVREIVSEARRRGIRCTGRGSAANSIVAFLLGITAVDPIKHNLLFERFLHGGRKGTPDIDVDFDSERREEIIAWMEHRFGMDQTAMTATLVTYRLRSALRDVAKTLGFPLPLIDELSKAVPPRGAASVRDHRPVIERILGCSDLTDTLINHVEGLDGCPRHLGLHSGGMILSRYPLAHFTPVQSSANGVTMVQFDKDDVEALGLVKFDVLGLRMLATLSEADELVARHYADPVDLNGIPLDDIRTFNLIRSGQTIGLFQIESQGQIHLLAKHQPECFQDLVTEVALFRPGPLQGGMVHPFIRRRRGEEPVSYDHPSLKPILSDTYGVILFQEQVLEVAHRFADMSLSEADAFRRLMSKFRDPGEMEQMRESFVLGAMARGIEEKVANNVFDKISGFVGYGFCRSHAAAFAKTVYQSAYLKSHYPAAYMASVMQHRPGMYDQQTLEQEARRLGVRMLPPSLRYSGLRFDLEVLPNGSLAIRKPLTSVKHVSKEHAKSILWARLDAPFSSVEDVYHRVNVSPDALQHLARAGAFHIFESDRRRVLWRLGALRRKLGKPGLKAQYELPHLEAHSDWDVPELPSLSTHERYAWDLETHAAAPRHPITLVRRTLSELEIRSIEVCYRLPRALASRSGGGAILTIAGRVMLRQRPPTAKGVMFVTLEDETGFVQCIAYPSIQARFGHVLSSAAIIARGELQVDGNWRGLVLHHVWRLNASLGGYEGHASYAGGRDRFITNTASDAKPVESKNKYGAVDDRT